MTHHYRDDMTNFLYDVPVRVLNREGCDLPSEFAGAVMSCYVAAPDYLQAVRRAKLAVEKLGYTFDDLASDRVVELNVLTWEDYVQRVWPEAIDQLPQQDELPSLVERGVVFLGPAIGFLNR